MAFSINTNLAALNAHRNRRKTDAQRETALTRLSIGLRINKAADDASGLSIADGFHAQAQPALARVYLMQTAALQQRPVSLQRTP